MNYKSYLGSQEKVTIVKYIYIHNLYIGKSEILRS